MNQVYKIRNTRTKKFLVGWRGYIPRDDDRWGWSADEGTVYRNRQSLFNTKIYRHIKQNPTCGLEVVVFDIVEAGVPPRDRDVSGKPTGRRGRSGQRMPVPTFANLVLAMTRSYAARQRYIRKMEPGRRVSYESFVRKHVGTFADEVFDGLKQAMGDVVEDAELMTLAGALEDVCRSSVWVANPEGKD